MATTVTTRFSHNLLHKMITNFYSVSDIKKLETSFKLNIFSQGTDKLMVKLYYKKKCNFQYATEIEDPINFFLNNITTRKLTKPKIKNILCTAFCYIVLNESFYRNDITDMSITFIIKRKGKRIGNINIILQNLVPQIYDPELTFSLNNIEEEQNFLICIDNIDINDRYKDFIFNNKENFDILGIECVDDNISTETCIICMEPGVSKTLCDHYIHKKCLLQVDNLKCPMCRTKLTPYIDTFLSLDEKTKLRYYNFEKKLISDIIQNLEYITMDLSTISVTTTFCLLYVNMFYFVLKHNKYNIAPLFDIIIKYNILSHKAFQKISNIEDCIFLYDFVTIDDLLNYILHIGKSVIKWVPERKISKYFHNPKIINEIMNMKSEDSYIISINICNENRIIMIDNKKKIGGSVKKIDFRDKLLSFMKFDSHWSSDSQYLIENYEYEWCKKTYFELLDKHT